MTNPRTHITLEHVAQAAGVTPMTISRFFRTPQKVSQGTRERISQAIEKLGYVADSTASRLAGKSRPMLAIVAPSLDLPYVPEIIEGVSEAADTVNAALMVFETRFSLEMQEKRIEAAIGWRPDGIIFVGDTVSDRSRRQITASGIPFVEAWAASDTPVGVDIGLSHRAIAAQMTGALIGAGYQTVAFGVRRLGYRVEVERLDGYLDAVSSAGRTPLVVDIADPGEHYKAGAMILRQALDLTSRPDALFLAGDVLAAGAIFECHRLGLAAPLDLAICGFGDSPISASIVPSLTTVRLPTRELGYAAVGHCIAGVPERVGLLAPEPIERESARLAFK